ncbi:hypothetical protein Q1695_014268 [Nippostrongylus brasiliensis]|nr:hypothetical protein Q1695_014268 [Nippostrongylus brasiliensis]
MGKKRFTKTPISGHWAQRFRRMRVYNPRATFEQAALISKLFEKNKKKPKDIEGKQSKPVEQKEAQPGMNIVDLPNDVLLKIFTYIANPSLYALEASLSKRQYGARHILAVRALYSMTSVCKRFRDLIHEYHVHFPKPPIGLRLQAPGERDRNYGGCVVAYIYGECGRRYFSKCVVVNEVPAAIFPGQISTFLIVKGLVITDALMDMLLSLDLSKVEELFWHDIRGSRATNLVEKMQALLSKMTSLCSAEFYSTNDFFDPTTMFPDNDKFWKELNWEKTDEKHMVRDEVRSKYRRLKKWASIRVNRNRSRRHSSPQAMFDDL